MKAEKFEFLMMHKSLLYAQGFMVKSAAFLNVIFLSVALATSNDHRFVRAIARLNNWKTLSQLMILRMENGAYQPHECD